MPLFKPALVLLAGGAGYAALELLCRGRTHWSMFLCGGLCTVLIGLLNERAPALPLSVQAFAGACIITALELVFGLLFNRRYAVWDYRALPHNFMGQICPQFFSCWIFAALLAVFLDDGVRYLAFGEPFPVYRLL